jgi:hypothetical protein
MKFHKRAKALDRKVREEIAKCSMKIKALLGGLCVTFAIFAFINSL